MNLTLHSNDTIYSPRHVPSWLLLAGAAGFVNGFAFLECEQYVTHVTGMVTRAGLEWPHVGLATEYAIVFASFLAGAIASVLVIQVRALRGKRVQWATPLFLVAMILGGVTIAGYAGAFGQYGVTHAADPPPFILLSLLALAMGMQNSAVASTTGLAVRTTHLTGPTTDLGIHLGSAILTTGAERRAALRGAALRGGKVVAFLLGAGLGLPLAGTFGFLALSVPTAFILAATGLSFIPDWSPSDSPFRTDTGSAPSSYSWGRPSVAADGPTNANQPVGSPRA